MISRAETASILALVYGSAIALVVCLIWFAVVLHHAHIHCIRGAHPAIVLEACAKVQK